MSNAPAATNDKVDQVIAEPVRDSTGLIALVESWVALDESFPEIVDEPVTPERIFGCGTAPR